MAVLDGFIYYVSGGTIYRHLSGGTDEAVSGVEAGTVIDVHGDNVNENLLYIIGNSVFYHNGDAAEDEYTGANNTPILGICGEWEMNGVTYVANTKRVYRYPGTEITGFDNAATTIDVTPLSASAYSGLYYLRDNGIIYKYGSGGADDTVLANVDNDNIISFNGY